MMLLLLIIIIVVVVPHSNWCVVLISYVIRTQAMYTCHRVLHQLGLAWLGSPRQKSLGARTYCTRALYCSQRRSCTRSRNECECVNAAINEGGSILQIALRRPAFGGHPSYNAKYNGRRIAYSRALRENESAKHHYGTRTTQCSQWLARPSSNINMSIWIMITIRITIIIIIIICIGCC